MTNGQSNSKIEVGKVQYYMALATLLLSIVSSIYAVGYTMRRVDEVYLKVESIEQRGSVTAQLTSKDVQWLGDLVKSFNTQLDRIERKLDQHIATR